MRAILAEDPAAFGARLKQSERDCADETAVQIRLAGPFRGKQVSWRRIS